MLFKKSSQSAPEPLHQLEWENIERPSQTLWISVDNWQYKVFPTRASQSFGTWMFQFEGRCNTGPLKGLVATAEIEALERGYDPGMLSDHWKSIPENIEGYAFLMEQEDRRIPPSFGVTLYCQESALDWIYRAFSSGVFGRAGGLGIELSLICPNNKGGPFWEEQWRKEWLQVSSWKIFAGAQLHTEQ
jgi:hypothetical protein